MNDDRTTKLPILRDIWGRRAGGRGRKKETEEEKRRRRNGEGDGNSAQIMKKPD